MGYIGNGTRRILVLISLSVFRDCILESRYCNPYLWEYNNFTNYMQIAFHDYITVLYITGEPIDTQRY
jgi:hypothetical protein